ncbi:hypothetical protein DXT76_15525 [Halobacillus trueperi]|uniref:Uncharacterized protein n=1 Tax=Halobacillus trueperi TaxID=156205 RepID=A0A3D8VL17_9BACI|nr:hypothetical protein DXT76_15525 [Halobacillus trueperi]
MKSRMFPLYIILYRGEQKKKLMRHTHKPKGNQPKLEPMKRERNETKIIIRGNIQNYVYIIA